MNFNKKVIDSHMHSEKWEPIEGMIFFEKLFGSMDEYQEKCGLEAFNICTYSFTEDNVATNICAALYKLHNPTAYAYGGIVYPELPARLPFPDGMDALTQYNELMEIGFDGIKMLETKTFEHKELKLPVNDEFYSEFFKAAEKDNTHFVWHVADPEEFWDIERVPKWALERGWYYGDGTYASNVDIYKQVFDVLEKCPNLNISFAHFFFMADHPEVTEKIFSKYKNVKYDITPGSEMYRGFADNHDYYYDFFIKYADRIMYGTDNIFPEDSLEWMESHAENIYNVMATDREVEIYGVKCKGFKLPEDVCNKIFYENFKKNCRNKPLTINKEALKKYIQKYAHLIKNDIIRENMLEYGNLL